MKIVNVILFSILLLFMTGCSDSYNFEENKFEVIENDSEIDVEFEKNKTNFDEENIVYNETFDGNNSYKNESKEKELFLNYSKAKNLTKLNIVLNETLKDNSIEQIDKVLFGSTQVIIFLNEKYSFDFNDNIISFEVLNIDESKISIKYGGKELEYFLEDKVNSKYLNKVGIRVIEISKDKTYARIKIGNTCLVSNSINEDILDLGLSYYNESIISYDNCNNLLSVKKKLILNYIDELIAKEEYGYVEISWGGENLVKEEITHWKK